MTTTESIWGSNLTEETNIPFPDDTQHLAIVGANGSGKTQAAMWHLSRRGYTRYPWIIYDFKYDDMINELDGVQHIGVEENVPTQPGIYIVHPDPDETELVEAQMKQIWQNENTGVYVDEGYMIGNNNRRWRNLLTQGRSKHIPIIALSQRPAWVDRFVFSEARFHQVFRLQNRKDLVVVNDFIPHDLSVRLPEYHSYYYDVGSNRIFHLDPVPDREAILSTFDARLSRLKKVV